MQEITLGLVVVLVLEVTALLISRYNKMSFTKTKPVFIDTSALMDGRIVFAAQAGFMPGQLVIPRSVIAELQLLADGSDHDKRSRARHGLDMVKMLQEIDSLHVKIMNDGRAPQGVDDKLLQLAKKYNGAICTIDFNLNKVAVVENIRVLNINELAQQLRLTHLPGEKMTVEILQRGSDAHQGVGYLADGTMVVVEQASRDIGKTIEVELIRSLQTAAGRMVFAKKLAAKPAKKQNSAHSSNGRARSNNPRSSKKQVSTPEDNLISLVDRQAK